ncbi:nucleotidyltransferase family protein [Rhodococcus pyridinivorans]|uniref:nucleotidyltransferase family protein n=2 Tax=Rhodococcus TaxID=1827 RepID=UPI00280ABCF2|nr:nucleotidyltransferase family protein [Rhodococcus pyridinivorans]WMM75088.1 nucleotidyltransferase family protein [Rhodococcus pyridinivorans]
MVSHRGRSLPDGLELSRRPRPAGRHPGLRVYAPHGFDDLFGMVLRPNPVLAPRNVYEAKARRWQVEWPRLVVEPWPER